MRRRIVPTALLLAAVLIAPSIASARPWSESADGGQRTSVTRSAPDFLQGLIDRLMSFLAAADAVLMPGG